MSGTVDGWFFPEETIHVASGQMLLWLPRPNTEKFGYSVRTSSFFASQVPVITGTQKREELGFPRVKNTFLMDRWVTDTQQGCAAVLSVQQPL